jgi:four helix bundle protein
MTIASKEARETRYWLKLLNDSHFIDQDLMWYLNEIEEINKILPAIIKTSHRSG